jgi:hypothetical protein
MSYSRFTGAHPPLRSIKELAEDDPAITDARTIQPDWVFDPTPDRIVIKTAANCAKLRTPIEKGRHSGKNFYYITKEERATCPSYCPNFRRCYGNGLTRMERFRSGSALAALLNRIGIELEMLSNRNAFGYVIRLFELGDFESVEEVQWWAEQKNKYPLLSIVGYTARDRINDPIGRELEALSASDWNRFSVRFSCQSGERSTFNINYFTRGRIERGLVCPHQTRDSESCADCALCWESREPIGFIYH